MAKHLIGELDLALLISQRHNLLLITLLLVLSTLLVPVLLDKDRSKRPVREGLAPEEVAYIPQYTLPHDAQWVVTYRHIALSPDLIATIEQPVSKKWVRQVAYHLIVAQQSLALQQDKKAAVHFEKALTIFPKILGVHGSLGTLYLQQQDLDKAIAHLETALEEERSFSVLNNLGAAWMAAGELKRAEEYLLQAQATQPEHPASYKNLALLYREAENPESSLANFKRYLELYDQDAETMETYAEYLIELDRGEEAAEFLVTYPVLHTDHAQSLYLLLAQIEARSTNSVQAVAALQKMSHYISPNLALTKLHLADFDSIRDTAEFQALVRRVELAMVTLKEGW
ncbi:MAG: tetratricopeptide repeat protein [Kiritimatiellaeota bacterium]|nr:tetratricopeptide repeat protein [Kiritimatiellota bacterium]